MVCAASFCHCIFVTRCFTPTVIKPHRSAGGGGENMLSITDVIRPHTCNARIVHTCTSGIEICMSNFSTPKGQMSLLKGAKNNETQPISVSDI